MKFLTREDILNIPDAPKGQRFCDFPEKDKEFGEIFLEIRKLLYEAAKDLCNDGTEKPAFWRRALEVLKATGLDPNKFNNLNQVDEIKVVRAAAKMKKQQRADVMKLFQA